MMNRNGMLNRHIKIDQFLEQLSKKLVNVPESEKEQHLLEIEGHLHALVLEKESKGENPEHAIEEALDEFISINDLALQINKDYKNKEHNQFGEDYGFKTVMFLPFVGFGQLAISIFRGELAFGAITVGLLFIILPIIGLMLPQIKWDGKRVDTLKLTGRYFVTIISSFGAIAFITRSILDRQPNYSSFFYMLGYLLLAIGLYFFFRHMYAVKKQEL